MTVNADNGSVARYNGNDVTVTFALKNSDGDDIVFFTSSEIIVTLTNTNVNPNVDNLQTEITDYTVSGGNGETGSVTFVSAPGTGYIVTLERVVAATQLNDFQEVSKFPAEIIERSLDRLTLLVQQALALQARSLRFPTSDDASLSAILPAAEDRAGKYFTFGATGEPTVAELVVTGTPVSTYIATLLNLASYTLLRNAIGLNANAKNFVINPIFEVNQGDLINYDVAADNVYFIDGWRAMLEAASAAVMSVISSSTVTITDSDGMTQFIRNRLRATVDSANNNKFGIFQVIESKKSHRFRTYKASLQMYLQRQASVGGVRVALIYYSGVADAVTGDPISSWGADGTNPTLAANWNYANTPTTLGANNTIYKIENITIPSNAQNLGILIWCDDKTTTAGDYFEVSNIQLERGEKCTEFVNPFPHDGLAECQRYYEVVAGNNRVIGNGVALTSTTARIAVPYKVTKFGTVTLDSLTASRFAVDDGTGTPVTCSAVALNSTYSTPEIAVLDITVASGLTAGRATIMTTRSSAALLGFRVAL